MNAEGIDRAEADALARAAADGERYERESAIDREATTRRNALNELDNQLRAEIRDLCDRVASIERAILPEPPVGEPTTHLFEQGNDS